MERITKYRIAVIALGVIVLGLSVTLAWEFWPNRIETISEEPFSYEEALKYIPQLVISEEEKNLLAELKEIPAIAVYISSGARHSFNMREVLALTESTFTHNLVQIGLFVDQHSMIFDYDDEGYSVSLTVSENDGITKVVTHMNDAAFYENIDNATYKMYRRIDRPAWW